MYIFYGKDCINKMEVMKLNFCMRAGSEIGYVIIPSRKQGIVVFIKTSLYPPSSSRNAVLAFRF